MTRPAPYVGVSGVVSPTQQQSLVDVFDAVGFPADRRLLLGVKATHKTQWEDITNKYGPEWYPVGEHGFANTLSATPLVGDRLWRVVQMYLDVDHVADRAYRDAFVDRIVDRGHRWLEGLQFDMLPWHTNPDMLGFLQRLRERTGLPVLLQCHGPAMRALGPTGAIAVLSRFAGVADFVLFDASHGTGARLDVDALSRFVDAAYSSPTLEGFGVAVAGGLSADTIEEDLPTLVGRFPDLSWDAEGSLHPVAADGTRGLSMDHAARYLAASARTLTL